MKRILAGWLALLITFGPAAVPAATTKAALLLSAATVRPGDTITAAVRLEMAAGWHTYWKHGGASGIPTSIKWDLPSGVTAGEIRWPVPEKLVPAKTDADGKVVAGAWDYEQTTYVLHEEAALLVPLTIGKEVSPGRIDVRAEVSWLECQVNCVPGEQKVSASLQIGDTTTPSAAAARFPEWERRLPKSAAAISATARWEQSGAEKTRSLWIEWQAAPAAAAGDFFAAASDDYEVQYPTRVVATNAGRVTIQKEVTRSGNSWPAEISGLIVQTESGQRVGYEVTLKIAESGGAGAAVTPVEPPAGKKSLWLWLGYALVGGLILNIMPCVLPVIALKILGFVGQAKAAPGRVRMLGGVYALGVLVSFLVLAMVVIGIKAAGHKAGWGMQFSNPMFIVAMAALITLVALNLFGIFEVTLGGRTLGAAGELASQHGPAGAFFNGVLATALSTPCSAPFLGAALGFAFSQPASIILLIFLTVGLGLASPYVLLSWQPAWLKFLPKPGAWMEKFKMAMGFPMLVTAVWLSSLVVTFYGEQSWWLGVFLVLLSAGAWVFGEFVQRGTRRKPVALGCAAGLLVLGYFWALESGLNWRYPQQQTESNGKIANAPAGYSWQRWSPAAVLAARSQGRVVVVDFTASWCQTCKISVKPGFEARAVVDKLKELRAVALVADYTSFPQEITEELEKFGRSAVPMVLVYPADAARPALVLPEPLPFPTPYAPVILRALENL